MPTTTDSALRGATIGCILAALAWGDTAAGSDIRTSGSFVSDAPGGTAPLVVQSTTRVDNLNADRLDGLDAADLAAKPAQVVTVSASGADFTSIQDAIDSITDAAASKVYVIEVGPGRYEETLFMKAHVHVRGAGRDATRIEVSDPAVQAVVQGASNSLLRDLEVRCFVTSGSGGCTGVSHADSGTFRLTHVDVRASKSTVNSPNAGTTVGIENLGSMALDHVRAEAVNGDQVTAILDDGGTRLILHQVEAVARKTNTVGISGEGTVRGLQSAGLVEARNLRASATHGNGNIGLEISGGASGSYFRDSEFKASSGDQSHFAAIVEGPTVVTFDDCRLESAPLFSTSNSYGLITQSATTATVVTILDSTVIAEDFAVLHTTDATVRIHASQLVGGSVAGGGTEICRYVTDESFNGFATSCP